MNNKCVNLKIKFNHKFECKKNKKETCLSYCKKCKYFKRKEANSSKYTLKQNTSLNRSKTPLKQVSKKQAKSEKKRYSIFTTDLKHCYLSKLYLNKEVPKEDLHEIFRGSKRQISKKWGMVIPVSREFHENKKLLDEWKIIGQKKFMEYYNKSIEEFIEIFGKSYL